MSFQCDLPREFGTADRRGDRLELLFISRRSGYASTAFTLSTDRVFQGGSFSGDLYRNCAQVAVTFSVQLGEVDDDLPPSYSSIFGSQRESPRSSFRTLCQKVRLRLVVISCDPNRLYRRMTVRTMKHRGIFWPMQSTVTKWGLRKVRGTELVAKHYSCTLPMKFGTAGRCDDLLLLYLKGPRTTHAWEAPAVASLSTYDVFYGCRVYAMCLDAPVAEIEVSVEYVGGR